MPQLIINRDSGYADSLRAYELLLDGHEIGRIRAGESKSFTITSGKHTIQAKIDWVYTPSEPFFAVNGTVSFEVYSKLRGVQLFGAIFAIFNPSGYIGIRGLDVPNSISNRPKQEGEDVPPNA